MFLTLAFSVITYIECTQLNPSALYSRSKGYTSVHKGRECADFAPAPELPEEDAASEADPESDEETALQWLSEPPPGFGRHLSGFGQLFTLLEGLVTERSAKLLRGSDSAGSGGLPMHSSLQVGTCPIYRLQRPLFWEVMI